MSEELPPIWALDKAAKAAERAQFADWQDVKRRGFEETYAGASIIAHAHTIAQYEQPPVDPDCLAVRAILLAFYTQGAGILNTDRFDSPQFQAALAQFKRELEARK